MSSDAQHPAIRVEGLGKRYVLGETHQFTRNLRETLMGLPRKLGRGIVNTVHQTAQALPIGNSRTVNHTKPTHAREEFWALRDVCLEIKQGEAVGIIGRNGAGKSTLLKVLSRITTPTTGRAEIRGRIGALLEVGTGMNPELTGRENIYLNGSIIGMHKREIDAKFDEIVDFAMVEKFLDTPLKRYSSGMRVRLGFAVAAHLEPEILIVDEVLAVGDAEFQRKCLSKMDDVANDGCTVILVSHNLTTVETLASRVVVMHGGQLVYDDVAAKSIAYYLENIVEIGKEVDLNKHRKGNGIARVKRFWLEDGTGHSIANCRTGQPFDICLEIESQQEVNGVEVATSIYSAQLVPLVRCSSRTSNPHDTLPAGRSVWKCKIPKNQLTEGSYPFNMLILSGRDEVIDFIPAQAVLDVLGGDYYGTGYSHPQSPMLIDQTWEKSA